MEKRGDVGDLKKTREEKGGPKGRHSKGEISRWSVIGTPQCSVH